MKKVYILGALAVLAGAAAGWWWGSHKAPRRPPLTILHVNDTHSQMEPLRSGDRAGMGGILERAAYVDSVRRADGPDNVLLLHGGDFCQGTTYFSEFKGRVEQQALNAMGYDVVTLGNHEFDNGIEALGEVLSGLDMPVVVCNYDFSPFEAGKYIRPCVVVEKAGRKIGVVGVLCNLKDMVAGDTANRIPAFDTVPTVQKYVDQLRPDCDLVIALTHIGCAEHAPGDLTDQDLVAATRGIDLVVGGHSHTFLDQPILVKNLDGKTVPVVQAGCQGVVVGTFHLR